MQLLRRNGAPGPGRVWVKFAIAPSVCFRSATAVPRSVDQEETHALQQLWLLDHIIVRAIVVPSVRAAMIFARPLDGTLSDRAILLTDNRHEPISLLLS
jgi:hypothetical protein